MSQEELAHAVGYSDKSSISRIEKGTIARPPALSLIQQFAEALDQHPEPLFEAAGYVAERSGEAALLQDLKSDLEAIQRKLEDLERKMGDDESAV